MKSAIRWVSSYKCKKSDISVLEGETVELIVGLENGSYEVIFITKSGKALKIFDKKKRLCLYRQKNDSDKESQKWAFHKVNTSKLEMILLILGISRTRCDYELDVSVGVVVDELGITNKKTTLCAFKVEHNSK